MKVEESVIEKYKNGLLSIQIEVTSKCNQKCDFCYAICENSTKEMETECLYSVLEEFKDLGGMRVT